MKCPFCLNPDTQVMETRVHEPGDAIRRRRRCAGCQKRFTTFERIEFVLPAIVKRDGSRVDFDRNKVLASIMLALRKRPVAGDAVQDALGRVESGLARSGLREVTSEQVGARVMEELRALDQVAYIRFASVYRNFADIEQFAVAVDEIKPRDIPVATASGQDPDAAEAET